MEYQVPKYFVVKRDIIEHINNEVYKVGELIPSERDLMENFDVSRITIRKALDELEQEGYLYKIQGKGTYVKGEQNRQNLFSLTSCTQDVIRLGMTPRRKLISSDIIAADKKRQNRLNLKDGDRVLRLVRVYYANDDPINYTITYLPYKYIEGIEKFDFSVLSLYDVLENHYQIKMTRAVRTVEAVIPHDEICDLLSVDNEVPLLLFQCTTYGLVNEKELPIETFKCYYRSDKFSFYINQVR